MSREAMPECACPPMHSCPRHGLKTDSPKPPQRLERKRGMERGKGPKPVSDKQRDRMDGMRYLAAERIYATIEATGVFKCEAFCGKQWDDPQTALNECQVAHIEPRGPASAVKRSRFYETSEHPGNLRVVCSGKCNRKVDARRSDDDLHFSKESA